MENIISYFGEYTAGVDGALSTFKFEYLTSLGFAAIVIFVGRWIVAHSAPLRKYAIPAPVVSGLIFSIIISQCFRQHPTRRRRPKTPLSRSRLKLTTFSSPSASRWTRDTNS